MLTIKGHLSFPPTPDILLFESGVLSQLRQIRQMLLLYLEKAQFLCQEPAFLT